jgi:hypothetical protein
MHCDQPKLVDSRTQFVHNIHNAIEIAELVQQLERG